MTPTDATDKTVTYTIEDAEGLTVSNTGLISWTADTPSGTYQTTVTTTDGGLTDTHSLTLTEPIILVDSFTIDPKSVSVEVGDTATTALTYVRPTNATDKTFNVAVDDETVATATISGTTITFTGIAEGETTFTVASNDGNVSNNGTVTVTEPEEETEG